jgi:hypothetical protein
MKDAIHQTAVKVYGIREHHSHDWFEANTMILQPLIEKKKTALLRNQMLLTTEEEIGTSPRNYHRQSWSTL